MQSAKRLRVYRHAEDLAVLIYALTRCLPSDERFGLVNQMRRAAVSIGSNIAEGCGRDSNAELLRFVRIAIGSATELEFQLGLVRRLALAEEAAITPALDSCLSLQRMLTRLVVRLRPAGEPSARASKENGRPREASRGRP